MNTWCLHSCLCSSKLKLPCLSHAVRTLKPVASSLRSKQHVHDTSGLWTNVHSHTTIPYLHMHTPMLPPYLHTKTVEQCCSLCWDSSCFIEFSASAQSSKVCWKHSCHDLHVSNQCSHSIQIPITKLSNSCFLMCLVLRHLAWSICQQQLNHFVLKQQRFIACCLALRSAASTGYGINSLDM